jgi:uncharacterized protein YktB (UPF0637 family)
MSTGTSSASQLSWQVLHQAALFETDRNKVPRLIEEEEKAILSRIKELFVTSADHIEEDTVLDDALYALHALRNCIHSEAVAA